MTNVQNFLAAFNNYKSDTSEPTFYINTSDSSLNGYIGVINDIKVLDMTDTQELEVYIWNDNIGYNMSFNIDLSLLESLQVTETKTVTKYKFIMSEMTIEIQLDK